MMLFDSICGLYLRLHDKRMVLPGKVMQITVCQNYLGRRKNDPSKTQCTNGCGNLYPCTDAHHGRQWSENLDKIAGTVSRTYLLPIHNGSRMRLNNYGVKVDAGLGNRQPTPRLAWFRLPCGLL